MTKRKVRTTINPEQELEVDQAEASRLKELDILQPDVPVKVASTRVDGGPGTEVALRADGPLGLGPVGLGPTHDIQTTMRPDLTITVSDVEYQQLLAEGLVYSGTPQSPAADTYDLLFASKVSGGTATLAALRAAFVPFWKAAETVTTGTVRVDATGHLITANSNRTTRSTYDATEQAAWTVVSGGGVGAVTSVAGRTGVVVLTSADLTDATTVGKALLTAASAAAQRTALGLATVAATGAYADLTGRPTLAAVATSGAYTDLSGKPTIPATLAVQSTVTASGALVVNAYNPVDASGGVKTMTLPTGQAGGSLITVGKLDTSINAVNVTGSINGVGSSTATLLWPNEIITFVADSSGSWWLVNGHHAKTSLSYKVGGAWVSQPQIGDWIHAPAAALSNAAFGNGELRLGEFFLPGGTYDQVAFNVAAAGSTGAVCKVVCYWDDGAGKAGPLALDTTAVDVTTTGIKTITGLSLVIPNGGHKLWVGTVHQGAPTTAPQVATIAAPVSSYISSSADPNNNFATGWGFGTGVVTGAAPASASTTTRTNRNTRLGFHRST